MNKRYRKLFKENEGIIFKADRLYMEPPHWTFRNQDAGEQGWIELGLDLLFLLSFVWSFLALVFFKMPTDRSLQAFLFWIPTIPALLSVAINIYRQVRYTLPSTYHISSGWLRIFSRQRSRVSMILRLSMRRSLIVVWN